MKITPDIRMYNQRPGASLHSSGGDFKFGTVPTDHGMVEVWFELGRMTPQFLLWAPPMNFSWQSKQRFRSWSQIQVWARKFAEQCARLKKAAK